MASVVAFNKNTNDNKYDIKICSSNPDTCNVHGGYYKLVNPNPKEWLLPFPSTADNTKVFLPSRVVEDANSFKYLVYNKLIGNPACLELDPCNIYSEQWCCKKGQRSTDSAVVDKDTDANRIALIVIMSIVVGMLLLTLIGLAYYLSR